MEGAFIMGFMKLFQNKPKEKVVFSPLNGQVIPLSSVKDPVFADGILGKGAAVLPSEGKLVSPVNGTILNIFPTFHAIGIQSEDGLEILIHLGFDTVELQGKYFKSNISEGDKVSVGDYFAQEIDLEFTVIQYEDINGLLGLDLLMDAGFNINLKDLRMDLHG